MNLGFLGLQFSFGLQQANMAPIYSYLGAKDAALPLLQLAGPMTGLLVQPLIGAMSDRTTSRWGRRTPYFLFGAVLCSAGLFLMPLSSTLLMAASLLWLLDVGNNVTMEPYRAYVSDRLPDDQRPLGFLSQSAFTGLGQMLAYLTPSILVNVFAFNPNAVDSHNIPQTTRFTFALGAALSLSMILWSILRVPEVPLPPLEQAALSKKSKSLLATVREVWDAILAMPAPMRKLALMSLFQWYAMFTYWNYVIYSIARSVYHTSDALTPGFRQAVLKNGEIGGFYNGVAFVAAFALMPFARRFGVATTHCVSLLCAAAGMLAIPHITQGPWLFFAAAGVGVGWASIMGNPYVIVARSIPPERTGVYMGIFNMMIVIPMLLNALTMPLYYGPLLHGDARNALTLAGVLMALAAASMLLLRKSAGAPGPESPPEVAARP
ncbi:MAG: MFS transporter [Caulobacteraceae bacterium]|nr:MFS transporter [Caulobacteraceae bacterium]